jgi:hypothetical protein
LVLGSWFLDIVLYQRSFFFAMAQIFSS